MIISLVKSWKNPVNKVAAYDNGKYNRRVLFTLVCFLICSLKKLPQLRRVYEMLELWLLYRRLIDNQLRAQYVWMIYCLKIKTIFRSAIFLHTLNYTIESRFRDNEILRYHRVSHLQHEGQIIFQALLISYIVYLYNVLPSDTFFGQIPKINTAKIAIYVEC